MTGRKNTESSYLGAETMPSGLAEINLTIDAWAEASSRRQDLPLPHSRPAGLIAIAARWMREVTG